MADRAALDRLLGGPDLAWLVTRVRARLPRPTDEPMSGVVQLREPTPAQRTAATRLVGRPKRVGSALRVDLAAVEEILRRGPWPEGLADAVVTLTGPVVDRRLERERDVAAWNIARAQLAPAFDRYPHLAPWWDDWCTTGGLKRTTRAEALRTSSTPTPAAATALVAAVAAVLDQLPAHGEPLAVLARRTLGDAHGLDAARPLGRLTTAVVAAAYQSPGTSTREIWAAAGVVQSSVASTVLCLGVTGSTRSDLTPLGRATATTLGAMRAARAPVILTLDQVRSGGVARPESGGIVHVCENPTIVEVAADRWAATDAGAANPVLVCTSGQPSTAVIELLTWLTGDGAECRYHGDFDWAGLRIATGLSARVSWSPWRYRARDYREAVAGEALARALTGPVAESPWDPDLARAMADHGLAVEEEAVADRLAMDLLGAAGSVTTVPVNPEAFPRERF